MNHWRVIFVEAVEEQILEQVMYIASDSIDNALAWEERLRYAIRELGHQGGVHAVDEAAAARIGVKTHKLVFERTYLIHYVVRDEGRIIEVINFRHGGRLPRRGEP